MNKRIEIKPVWTDADYELMGWHDCSIRAVAFLDDSDYDNGEYRSELAFDIDYIFKWVPVERNGATWFSFYISPCTLIFECAYDVSLNLSTVGFTPVLPDISDLTMEADEELLKRNRRLYNVRIEMHNSEPITFHAEGFKQYVRKEPVLAEKQHLSIEQRGGIRFERKAIEQAVYLE